MTEHDQPNSAISYHELKTWPDCFDAVKRGDKPFDVRKNDRGFRTGDLLALRKWCPENERWLTPDGQSTDDAECADTILARVSYVLSGAIWGIQPGYVVMGFKFVESMTDEMIRGFMPSPSALVGRTVKVTFAADLVPPFPFQHGQAEVVAVGSDGALLRVTVTGALSTGDDGELVNGPDETKMALVPWGCAAYSWDAD